MAHLTRDNAKAALKKSADALAAIRKSSGENAHLLVLKQTSDWSNKQFLATPISGRWAAAMAIGREAYPAQQGGASVYNDTQQLVNRLRTQLDATTWISGFHPCWLYCTRGTVKGPYSKRLAESDTTTNDYAEYGRSAIALQYDLKHLHLSRLTFSAFIRVYCPSLLASFNNLLTEAYIPAFSSGAGGMYGNTSKLHCIIRGSLFAHSSDVCEEDDEDGHDVWEINGAANNGRTASADDTRLIRQACNHNPWHRDDTAAMKVYSPSQLSTGTSALTMYYHDFQITNAAHLDYLKRNKGKIWVHLAFHAGNPFGNGQSMQGILQNVASSAWFYRADLVFKCTGSKLT